MKLMTALLTAVLVLFSVLGSNAYAAQCKGMKKTQCSASNNCVWVDGYKRKDGKKVKSYCRNGKGKAKAASKKSSKKTTTSKSKSKASKSSKKSSSKKASKKKTSAKKASTKKSSTKKSSAKKTNSKKKSSKKKSKK